MKWIKDTLSVDEVKISALVVCLFMTHVFVLWYFYDRDDIPDNLFYIDTILIGAISGINIASYVGGKGNKAAKLPPTDKNQDQ